MLPWEVCETFKLTPILKKTCKRLLLESIRTIVPEKNCPPVRVEVSVKVRVSFRVGGATRQLPRRKIAPWLGLGFGLWLILGLGGNFPRTFWRCSIKKLFSKTFHRTNVSNDKYSVKKVFLVVVTAVKVTCFYIDQNLL